MKKKRTNDCNRSSTKEDIHVTNKHIVGKVFSIHKSFRKGKATPQCDIITLLPKWLRWNRWHSDTVDGSVKWHHHFGKLAIYTKTNLLYTLWSKNSSPGIYSKEMNTYIYCEHIPHIHRSFNNNLKQEIIQVSFNSKLDKL